MSFHTWCCQDPHRPSSCTTFTLNPHWGRAATGKKSLASMCTGSLWSCLTICDPVDCGLQASLSGGSPGKNTGAHWPTLTATPFQSTVFPSAPAASPPENLVLPEPLQPKQGTSSTPGPHRGKPKSSRAASGAHPSGRPTCRGGNKTTFENKGVVWLRKKTQNLPTNCRSCRLNPHNQLGRLSMEYIKDH